MILMRKFTREIAALAGFMLGALCLFSSIATADTTEISVWRNLVVVPITFRPEAGIWLNYDLPPINKFSIDHAPQPSDELSRFAALFPTGGGVPSSSPLSPNPDPLIPAPGTWILLSDNASSVGCANQGGFICRVSDPLNLCVNVDGGNPTACQDNAAGDAQVTASGSGTTLTITAIPSGSPSPSVIAGATITDGLVNIPAGTYIVTPVANQNPLTSASACLPACVVTLNQAVTNSFSGETITVNPATYNASSIASQFTCNNWSSLAPFSAPAIDPATGRVWYTFPGGHDSQCNAVGVMEFDPLVAVENKQGPSFNGSIGGSGNTLTVDTLNGGSLSGFDSIQIGQTISNSEYITPATITAFGSGTGGPGTYTISGPPQFVSGIHFTATNPTYVSGWDQVVMPSRFQSISVYPVPGWGSQPYVDPVAHPGGYYLAPNFYGQYTWQSTHTYQATGAPGGFATGAGTFAFNVETGISAGNFVDSNYQNITIGPLGIPNNSSAGYTFNGLALGYAQQNPGTNASVLAAWGLDNTLYSVGVDSSDNFQGVFLNNPFPVYENGVPLSNSTWNVGAKTGTACFADYGPAVVIDDQIDGGSTKMLVERSLSTHVSPDACSTDGSHLQTAGNINSSDAGTLRTITLSGTSPFSTNCGGSGCGTCSSESFCGIACTYDPIHKLIYCTDGSRGIEVITPNGTTTWTVATGSNSSTGSPPPDPTSGICAASVNSGPALQFIDQNGAGYLEFAKCGDVWRVGLYDSGCPSPTADGTILTGGVGRQCYLTDSSGNDWRLDNAFPDNPFGITSRPIYPVEEQPSGMSGFAGVNITVAGGQPNSVPLNGVELELKGGSVYVLQQNEAFQRWTNSAGLQVTGPGGSTVGTVSEIGATQYNFPASVDYNVTSGQTITILSQTGVRYWQSGGFEGALIISPNYNPGTHSISGVRVLGTGTPLYAGNDYYNRGIVNNYSADNTVIDTIEAGFHHDPEFDDAGDCIHDPNNNTNITLIAILAHDCDNGIHLGGQNGTVVENNVTTWHNGGDGGDGSATHGQYLSSDPYASPHDPTTGIVNGGGSYCERNVDRLPVAGATGFPFKERYGVFKMFNFTIAEPDNIYSDCEQIAAFDPTCGGAVTLGGADQSAIPASVTSSGTTATVTVGSVTATSFAYNSTTGEVDATVPATNFLPGVRFLVSGISGGSGSTSSLAGDWASSVGSGTTLTYYIQTGLTISGSITANIQYELPYNVGAQFLATMSGFTPSGYNATQTLATVTSLTTFTYTLGSSLGTVAGMGTFTIPGGVVFEAGPDYESTPYSIIDYGDNLNSIEGDCAFTGNTISASSTLTTGGTLTIVTTTPISSTGPFAQIKTLTGTGSGCSDPSIVGSPSPQLNLGSNPNGTSTFTATVGTGLTCTITGGTVYFPNQYATNSVTLNNCIMINDSGETTSSNGVEAVVVRDVRSVAPTTTVTNCVFIDPRAANLAAAMGVSYTDGGGNVFYHTRAEAYAAGVKFPNNNYKYPSIPYPMSLPFFFPAFAWRRRRDVANDNEIRAAA